MNLKLEKKFLKFPLKEKAEIWFQSKIFHCNINAYWKISGPQPRLISGKLIQTNFFSKQGTHMICMDEFHRNRSGS